MSTNVTTTNIAALVLERCITVSPPIYGSKKQFIDCLLENNQKLLLANSPIVNDAIKWMTTYMSKRISEDATSCTNIKEYRRAVPIALAKRIPIQRFNTLVVVMELFPRFIAPTMTVATEPELPAPALDAMHKIDVPAVARKLCAVCDNCYVSLHKCDKCLITLRAIFRTPGYHPGKFANDIQALRYLKGASQSEYKALMAAKKDHKPKVERPKVAKQPPRDFTLQQLLVHTNKELSRADKRMQEYIAKLGDHMPKEGILPHDADLGEIWTGIKNFLNGAMESGLLPVAAIVALAGAATLGIVIWIWRSESPYTHMLLKMFGVLIAAGGLFWGISSALAQIIGSLVEAYDEHTARKEVIEENERKIKEDQKRVSTALHEIPLEKADKAPQLARHDSGKAQEEISMPQEWVEAFFPKRNDALRKSQDNLRKAQGVVPPSTATAAVPQSWEDLAEDQPAETKSDKPVGLKADAPAFKSKDILYTSDDEMLSGITNHILNNPIESESLPTSLTEEAIVNNHILEKNELMWAGFISKINQGDFPYRTSLTQELMGRLEEFDPADFYLRLPKTDYRVHSHNPKGDFIQVYTNKFGQPPNFHTLITEGPDHDKKYRRFVKYDNKVYVSRFHSTVKEGDKEAAFHALMQLNLDLQSSVIVKHNGDDPIIKAAEHIMTVTAKEMHPREKGFMKSTLDYIHSTASLIRDVKTTMDVLQPAVECIIGIVYEQITDRPWVPWSERNFGELFAPILKEYKEFNEDANRITKIHSDKSYRVKIENFKKKVDELETRLMKMRTPPRYLVAIVAIRNDVAAWVDLCASAAMTAHDRPEPVCLMLFGLPGTGKTTAIEQFNTDLAETYHEINPHYPPIWNANMRYMYELINEFFDGCKDPAVIGIDDMYQSKDETIRTKESLLIVHLVNRAAFPLHCADINLKDKMFAKPLTVQITRNGKQKISNMGITDPMAVERRLHLNLEMLPESNPADKDTWRFNRYGPGGVLMQANMTYQEVLVIYKALLKAHTLAATRTFEVTKLPALDVNLAEIGKQEKERYAKMVREASSNARIEKKEARVRKHGATLGREEDILPEDIILDLDDIEVECDTVHLTSGEIEAHMRRLEELADKIDIELNIRRKPNPDAGDVLDAIASFRKKLTISVLRTFTLVKDWTIAQWERFTRWMGETKDAACAAISASVFVGAIKSATTNLLTWISESTFAKVVVAFSAVATVAALIAGIVMAVRSNDNPDPHSRTEKEDKRDRARARKQDDYEDRYEMRKGKAQRKKRNQGDKSDEGMYNKEGKKLPKRMQEAKPHLRESDMALINSFAQNLYAVMIQDVATISFGQVLMLEGTIGVTAWHVAKKMMKVKEQGNNQVLLTQSYVANDKAHYNRMNIAIPEVVWADKTELAFLVFGPSMRPHADITRHLMTDDDINRVMEYGIEDIAMIYRDRTGQRQIVEATHGTVEVMKEGIFEDDEDAPYLVYDARTVGGASGGLTMTNSTVYPRKIMALHAGGSHATAYDSILTYELYKSMPLKSNGSIVLTPELAIEPHMVTCTPKDQIVPLGTLKHGHSSGGKNTIAPSPLSKHLRFDPHYPIQPVTIPTVLYDRPVGDVADQWIRKGMLDPQVKETLPDPEKVLRPRENAYAVAPPFVNIDPHLLHYVYDPNDLPYIPGGVYHMLSFEQAVFGVPELGIPPIDFTTSCGYNWNPKEMPVFTRQALFGMKTRDHRTHFEEWHPELRRALKKLLEVIAEGNFPVGPVVDALKAERRKILRVLAGNTRMFYAGSIVYLIVSRMITAHLTAVEKHYSTVSTSAVGISATSHEWKELHHRLAKHPDYIVTDQVNFDMHNQLVLTHVIGERQAWSLSANKIDASRIKDVWREVSGRDFAVEDFRHWYKAMCLSTCVAAHVDGARVYLDAQTTNSGVDRTSQLNSYRNKLSIRAVFHVCGQDKYEDELTSVHDFFNRHVETALYGDDQIISLDSRVITWFTPYDYAEATRKLLGGRVTTPSKTPITPDTPYTNWDEVELLKRNFRKIDGNVYAPLQKQVIEESLHWVNKAAYGHFIAAETVRSALLEAAFHGREYFDLLSGVCERACRKAGVEYTRLDYDKVRSMVEE